MASTCQDGTQEEFNYVIKHTFIEVKSLEGDSKGFPRAHMRRISEPARASPNVTYTESLPTPSTCMSVNGDDLDGDGTRSQERRYSYAASVDSDDFIGASNCFEFPTQPSVQSYLTSDNIGFESSYLTSDNVSFENSYVTSDTVSFENSYVTSDNIGFENPYLTSDTIGAVADLQGFWSYSSDEMLPPMLHYKPEIFSTASPLETMQPVDPAWQDSIGGEIEETRTTVMVRNMQSSVTQASFVKEVCEHGFLGLFDFVYMPMNFRAEGNFGYAFVNFISAATAIKFMEHLQSLETDDQSWRSVWSTCQGLDANIERYRNSPLMHELIPADCKPAIYDESGTQVSFPAPTKPFKKPRIHFAKQPDDSSDSSPKRSEVASEVDKAAKRECRPGRSKKQQQQHCQASPAQWTAGGHVVTEGVMQQHVFMNDRYLAQPPRASPR